MYQIPNIFTQKWKKYLLTLCRTIFYSHIPLWLCHEQGLSLPRVLEWATLSTPCCALTPWPKATGQGRVPSFPFHHSAGWTLVQHHTHHTCCEGPSLYWLRIYWMSYFRSEGWFHRCHHVTTPWVRPQPTQGVGVSYFKHTLLCTNSIA